MEKREKWQAPADPKKLFEPVSINNITLKNRFFQAAIADSVKNGVFSQATLDRYKAVADG